MIGDKVLLDGDIVAYYAASAIEYPYRKDLGIKGDKTLPKEVREEIEGRSGDAEDVINTVIGTILHDCWTNDYNTYLTGTSNFRDEFSKSHVYKGNRKGTQKPILLKHCRDYLIKYHGAVVSYNEEADDLIAIAACDMGYKGCIVASTDKDFLQLPCRIYSWRKRQFYHPTEEEALVALYSQMLTGDDVDNIVGIRGIGPKTAEKILKGLTDEQDLYRMCLKVYQENDMTEDQLIENARLLYLRRKPKEIWEAPV